MATKDQFLDDLFELIKFEEDEMLVCTLDKQTSTILMDETLTNQKTSKTVNIKVAIKLEGYLISVTTYIDDIRIDYWYSGYPELTDEVLATVHHYAFKEYAKMFNYVVYERLN